MIDCSVIQSCKILRWFNRGEKNWQPWDGNKNNCKSSNADEKTKKRGTERKSAQVSVSSSQIALY